MQQDFTHYLITRFNVPVKRWETDKTGKRVLDRNWMEHRLELFRKYCAPTIQGQTHLDFSWLIYCGTQTDGESLEKIKSAIAGVSRAEIRVVDDFEGLLADLRQTLLGITTPFVVTSRLDNDDGLGPDFVRHIHDQFKPRHNLILNFSKGILYDAYRKVMTEVRNSPRNHYGSLIESVNSNTFPLTVLGYPHGIPPEGTEILDLSFRYSWLKIIHDRNMASRTNGWPIFNNHVVDHFKLSRKHFPISWSATLTYIVIRSLSRIKRKLVPQSAKTA